MSIDMRRCAEIATSSSAEVGSTRWMKAYTNAVLEAAAKVCDDLGAEPCINDSFSAGTGCCGRAIRSMKAP